MKKLRAWLAYSFYVFVLGAIFVYILFPSEAVNRYIVTRVAAVSPDVQLSIGDVSPVLPPGLKLNRVTIALDNGSFLEAPVIRIYPRWLSLLGKKPSVAYSAVAGQGKIRGAATFSESPVDRRLHLEADLESVRMEQLGSLQPIADYGFEGTVSGNIRYASGKNPVADVRLTATDVALAPPRPVLGIRRLRFASVRTEVTLQRGNLEFSRVVLAGEQMNGELTGSVVLGQHLMDSTVSMGGTLQIDLRAPGSETDSRTGSPGGGLSLAGRVPVRIQGTLANPRVSLR